MKEASLSEIRDVVIVHGPPGAGKGTMAQRFVNEHAHSHHISAGDTVRAVLNGSFESRNARSIAALSEQGLLMPGAMSTDVMLEAIEANGTHSLILIDGYPQTKSELDTLLLRADDERIRITGALCLEVGAQVSIDRMEQRGLRVGERLRQHSDALNYYRQRYERFMQSYPLIKAELGASMDVTVIDASDDESIVYDTFARTILQQTN